jgi:deoxyribonuclease V
MAPLLACVDVDYRSDHAAAACVLLRDWTDATPRDQLVARVGEVAPYESGAFYKRELPCILAVLARVSEPLGVVVVDGYVWLDARGRPGLGAHLYEALGRAVAVVGVAKKRFGEGDFAEPVRRGTSDTPLWVTAAGMDRAAAADHLRAMHGAHRVPTMLTRVDRLCRDADLR